ncbi:hypothetical protein [Caballeronia sordidicola]|uniref:hypothetical protein n=1 Tax=Caballeronia sordidicola TaxID=196367 RepID=UPI0015C61203|nr:hypothetical protein [Caballeronia sordidicola]
MRAFFRVYKRRIFLRDSFKSGHVVRDPGARTADQVIRASIRNQQQYSPVFVERPVDKV